MANPQHAKTPKLNALLIGKRTVPSGCRVLNVSQQGMSLQCDPDGRLLTFSSGDAVDIYLSVQHANGHNKFTIPAIVSHVDESLVDVVFHCTDTELAGLIESYRTSESHDLEATIDHRLVSKTGVQAKPVAVNEALGERQATGGTTTRGKLSFYTGLLALFITSLVLLGAYYYVSSINKRLSSLESISRTHTEELSDVQSQVFSSRLQDGRYASLNARMKALTDAFQSFEKRVSTAMLQGLPAEAPEELTGEVPVDLAAADEAMIVASPEIPVETPTSEPAIPAPAPVAKAKAPPKPVTAAAPQPRKAAVIEEKPATASIVDASKPSPQKYPAIEVEPTPLPAVTEPTPAVTKYAVNEIPVDQAITQVKTTTVVKTDTRTAAPVPTEKQESTAGKPDTPTKAAPPTGTPQPQAKRATITRPSATATSEAITTKTPAGPWIINLMSSPSKAYVEKMHATASAGGIDTVIASAEVKGKQYWRLQIPGFDSMSAAKRAAEPVKKSLKIQDVWIFKRKR